VADKDQKTRWGNRIAKRYPGANAPESNRLSGPGQEVSASPVIRGVKVDDGESEIKVREVLVKVYEPGRLQRAWQQVRKNAGAAGIDQMTVEEFAQREEHLLALIHDKLTSGSYRFQPARRVVLVEDGRAVAVRLSDGDVIDVGQLVASNIDPQQLALHLLGDDVVGSKIADKMRRYELGESVLVIYLALDRPVHYKAGVLFPTLFREAIPGYFRTGRDSFCRIIWHRSEDDSGSREPVSAPEYGGGGKAHRPTGPASLTGSMAVERAGIRTADRPRTGV
jgi:hypothetical protein